MRAPYTPDDPRSSNAYTGRSMRKSKIAHATLAFESPVGGLVIATKSLCKDSPNHSSIPKCPREKTTLLGRMVSTWR